MNINILTNTEGIKFVKDTAPELMARGYCSLKVFKLPTGISQSKIYATAVKYYGTSDHAQSEMLWRACASKLPVTALRSTRCFIV